MRVRGVEGRGDFWRSGVCQPLILPIRLTNERGQCSWAAGCWLQVQVGGGGACGGGQHLPGGGLLRLRLQLLQHHQLPRRLRPHLRPPQQLRVHERTHLLHHSHRRRPGSLLQQPPHATSLPQEGLRNHGLALHRHPRPSPGQERVGPGGGAAGAGRSGWGLFRYCLHLCEGIRAAGAEREVRALFATVLRAGDGLQLPANFPTCPHRAGGNLLAVGVRLPAKLHRAAPVPFRAPLPLRNPKVPHPEARELITRFIKDEYVEERMGELKRYIDDMHHHGEQFEMMEMDDGQVREKNPNPEDKKRKCRGGHRLSTRVVYHLAVMQQMTAIQVVYIYVGEIVLQVYPSLYMFIPVLVHSQGVLAIFLSMQFTKTYGRKDILQFGCLGCAISLFVISGSFFAKGSQPAGPLESVLIVGSLFALRIIFSFTFAALYPMYISEIAEPKAISDCSTYGFVIAAGISLIFPLLEGWFGGPAVAFLIFGVYTFLGWVANREFMVETKDKIEVQIREEYQELYEKWFGKTK